MQITWKDVNQGGAIGDKVAIIKHSDFYSEEVTLNGLKRRKDNLLKTIDNFEEDLRCTTGKFGALEDFINQ